MIRLLLKNTYFFSVLIFLSGMISCKSQIAEKEAGSTVEESQIEHNEIIVGANNTEAYFSILRNKNVAVVANQTSVIFKDNRRKTKDKRLFTHLADSLLASGIKIQKVFSPEHGFRGEADAGEIIVDRKDTKTGLPIVSLYGKNKKPSQEQLKDIDIVVFDIQDVGVRFYTYLSTLHYVMEACAEAGIPVIVLDRPNPNGYYIDGPTLEIEHKSFLGMHPVPLVYGMTIGEYAQMINGENWLKDNLRCELTVIPLQNYTHDSTYSLSIRPSPNLPNDKAINLYPSLGLFEGTTINAGRGTEMQFQVYGAPFFPKSDFTYIPKSNFGSKYPKHKEKLVNGNDLRSEENQSKVNLEWLIDAYSKTPKDQEFFGGTFTVHAGTKKLQEQIENGFTQEQIKETWQEDLEVFKKVRSKYLLYD
jgi:uncharacterized protein YbbC (DUF1343 family)